MDYENEVLKNVEKRRLASGLLRRIDSRVLVASVAAMAVIFYLYSTGGMTKESIYVVVGSIVVLLFVLGNRESLPEIIPIEEIAVIFMQRMKKLNAVTNNGIEISSIGNIFILYHVNNTPKSYDIRWVGTFNKKDTAYVTEIDATRGHLIKTRVDTKSWNADKPTNTIVETRYVPDSKLLEYSAKYGR